jgi:excisionase family DNA binding protein
MGRAMDRKLLTIKDVATALNCSRTTIWRKVKDGSIPKPMTVCGMTRWSVAQIEGLIASASAPTPIPQTRVRVRRAA